MVNNLINNFIPTQQFIYTYAQVDDLYNLLYELLTPIQTDIDIESNDVEIVETNSMNDESDWTDDEIITHEIITNDNVVNIYDTSQNIQYYYNIQQNQNINNINIFQNQTNQIYVNNLNNLNNLNGI